MIFSGVEDGSGKAVRLHANFSSELHMRTTDQVAGENQELKKSPTKLLLQSFLFSNLTQLNNVRALLEQTVGGHIQQLFDLVTLFRLDSQSVTLSDLLLLFSQEHHPWQWLSGKCQQGDFPVVYRWRAGQLHELCLQLALLNLSGSCSSAPTGWKPVNSCLRFLFCP